jgi:hypothetical protein
MKCRVGTQVRAFASVVLVCLAGRIWAQSAPWMNGSLLPEQRTSLLLEAMTQEEKFKQMVVYDITRSYDVVLWILIPLSVIATLLFLALGQYPAAIETRVRSRS